MTKKTFDEILIRDLQPGDDVPGVGIVEWVEYIHHRDVVLAKFTIRDLPVTYEAEETFIGVTRHIPRPDSVDIATRTNTITVSRDFDRPDTYIKLHIPAAPQTSKPAYGRVIKADHLIQALRDLGYLED